MSNINQSLNIGKNCDDLVYFVEDDYLHKRDAIEEMILSYERISSQIGKELIMCPADYPYLYNKLENSKIILELFQNFLIYYKDMDSQQDT